jgi:hypothetical protein
MDDRVFVISDVSVDIELLQGRSIVTFNGTFEWALDYTVISETVWLPTEEQLRRQLEQRLADSALSMLKLIYAPDGYCEIQSKGKALAFLGADAVSEAYAEALLHVLEENR